MRISDWSSDVCSSDLLPAVWRTSMRRCGPKHSTNLWARKAHGKICVSLLKRQERAVKRWIMCCSLAPPVLAKPRWRKSSHGKRSDEHTSELQSLMRISYAVFSLQKKTTQTDTT